MEQIKFSIGRTRHCHFTKDNLSKLNAGIDIFLQVLQHKDFQHRIESYVWKVGEKTYFNRFLLCNQLSNQQVWESIISFCTAPNEQNPSAKKVNYVALFPCNDRRDTVGYTNFSKPTIWMNLGYLNQDWYTPVHVASCIAHELCDNLGFHTLVNGEEIQNRMHTVPYFCGQLVLEICKKWEQSVTDIRDSFAYIDETNFEYFPCSAIFQIYKSNTEVQTGTYKMAQLIDHLLMEMNHLKQLPHALTAKERIRYTTLEKSVQALYQLQIGLSKTSLDGGDALPNPFPTDCAYLA